MVRRLVFLLIVVAALALFDLAARVFVEAGVAEGIRQDVEGVANVDVDISSFPFLGRLLVSGEVTGFTVRLERITDQPVDVTSLVIDVDGAVFDRGRLLREQRAEIDEIEAATATAVITEAALSAAVDARVDLEPGQVTVFVGGQPLTAEVVVEGGVITVRGQGVPALSVPVPTSDLLPCPVEGRVEEDQVELTCTSDRLPPIVVDAIASADLREAFQQ